MHAFLLFCCLAFNLIFAATPEEAATKLKEGNRRFVAEASHYPNRCAERRLETSEKQEPFAAIVACSDSRVAPEIVFDQGLGHLFIVRIAGNVIGATEQNSIDYAVLQLHAPLIVVVGHQNCGAVKAVLDGTTEGIEAVAKLIQPAVNEAKKQPGDPLTNAIKNNARMAAAQLRKDKVLAKLIKKKKLLVKAAYYNFLTGEVEMLSD